MRLANLLAICLLLVVQAPLLADCPPREHWRYWVRVVSCSSPDRLAATKAGALVVSDREEYVRQLLEATPGHLLEAQLVCAKKLEPLPADQSRFRLGGEPRTVLVQTERSCEDAHLEPGELVVLEFLPSCCDVIPPHDLECLLNVDRLFLLGETPGPSDVSPDPSLERTPQWCDEPAAVPG